MSKYQKYTRPLAHSRYKTCCFDIILSSHEKLTEQIGPLKLKAADIAYINIAILQHILTCFSNAFGMVRQSLTLGWRCHRV